MRRTARSLGQWGKLHRLNDYLDENVLTKQTKPPPVSSKMEFEDWSRMQDFARRGKERLEPEEAPLEPFLRDPSGKNLSHTEGLDSTVNFERYNSSKIARGIVMNRWVTPFQVRVIRYRTLMHLTPRGKVGRIECMVMVGNGNGVAGLGVGRHNNFRAKGPVTDNAIEQAFRNLVAIHPDPPYILHTIRVQWQHQKLVLTPCDRIVAPYYIRQAAEMFGLKGFHCKVIKRFRKHAKPNGLLHAFFLAMEKYHRSASEIAAARGLVPQGHIGGVKSYVEEIRAFKGMYSKSPPVSNRDTAADRWKWDAHRHQVLQYPNPQMLHEIMYSDVHLGMAAAQSAASAQAAPVTPVASESMPPGPMKDKIEEANSGRTVSDRWEREEPTIRKLVQKEIAEARAKRAGNRRAWVKRVMEKTSGLQGPDVDEAVRKQLETLIRRSVQAGAPA